MTDILPPRFHTLPDAPTNLVALADELAAIGQQAAMDDEYGSAWAIWADWCWRAGVPALPANLGTTGTFVADATGWLDPDDLLDVLDAISRRHHQAGHPDPFLENL